MSDQLGNSIKTTAVSLGLAVLPVGTFASSHMDAPLIAFDETANTTDVSTFLSEDPDNNWCYLTTALLIIDIS